MSFSESFTCKSADYPLKTVFSGNIAKKGKAKMIVCGKTVKHLPEILFFILLSFTVSGCARAQQLQTGTIVIGNTTLKVEIAATEEERAKGLMHRKSLESSSGMLFVFEKDSRLSFWMKDTSIPLSIAFISTDGTIKEICDMVPYSLEPVRSSMSVRYALEVNRGYFSENGIKPGDTVILPEQYRR